MPSLFDKMLQTSVKESQPPALPKVVTFSENQTTDKQEKKKAFKTKEPTSDTVVSRNHDTMTPRVHETNHDTETPIIHPTSPGITQPTM